MIKEPSFLRNHADTISIIAVNICIAVIMITLHLSNVSSIAASNSRIDAANARMDTLHVMFYDLLKEGKK